MPIQPTYPGVYIEEIPSGVHTITGVATSITAFIGRAKRGLVNNATTINSYGDFENQFGGLWDKSTLGYAVRDFYLNGGSQAVIIRLFNPSFANPDDQADAQKYAKQVSDAIAGSKGAAPADVVADGQKAVDAVNKDTAASDAGKAAAAAVLAEAQRVAGDAKATVDTVKAAAQAALKGYNTKARLTVDTLTLEAASEGSWGNRLRASVDTKNITDALAKELGVATDALFNLNIYDGDSRVVERFMNLTVIAGARQVDKVLLNESALVRVAGGPPSTPPKVTPAPAATPTPSKQPVTVGAGAASAGGATGGGATGGGATTGTSSSNGATTKKPKPVTDPFASNSDVSVGVADVDTVTDGNDLTYADSFAPDGAEALKVGLYALEQVDLFNLLCIPPYKPNGEGGYDIEYADATELIADAVAYCEKRRAVLLLDSPHAWTTKAKAIASFTSTSGGDLIGERSSNAAVFFPRILKPNPLHNNQLEESSVIGTMAGVFARTDAQRGVWKAPAGIDASLVGAPQLTVNLTDAENGELNPLGINCLRSFPIYGRVSWGSRTLRGADQFADDYKYIPVRRVALFIEESLYRGTKWAVFEPNDEPLWSQIRLNVGAFMHDLFRQGAFQGQTPRDAYFVKCDKETTTQNDINLGIVNVIVGFAPLKPAEFVIIQLQQMAGQIAV